MTTVLNSYTVYSHENKQKRTKHSSSEEIRDISFNYLDKNEIPI